MIPFDLDVSVDKRMQQEGGSVIKWAGIVDQRIIEPFRIDERPNWIELTFTILLRIFSLHGSGPSLGVLKWSVCTKAQQSSSRI